MARNGAAGGVGGEGGAGGATSVHNGTGGTGGPGANGGAAMGGAIAALGGNVTVFNATIASNVVVGGPGGEGGQGGPAYIHTYPGQPGTNGVSGVGQGDSVSVSGGVTLLKNSIFAANAASDTNIYGVIHDGGNNLDSDSQNTLTSSTSMNGVDPKLAPLGNYGGPTPTMALLPGSPAIDAADPASYPATDQRGYARPYGVGPDIGAFEYVPGVIAGRIAGLWSGDQAIVFAGESQTATTNGAFFFSLPAGSYTVTPSNANYVFSPAAQTLSAQATQTNVVFQAYHRNAITVETAAAGYFHVGFAGTNGQTYRIFVSTNLTGWSPLLTNSIGLSGVGEVVLPMTNQTRQFYRAVTP
ncbi:MAG TPA: choice-of-anchor Q domain-containing protein [Verrucomicrobiae bacterium]|nr:choice-of-anchor Q domain-containing protein [Verrucomicrobiae bacterium]